MKRKILLSILAIEGICGIFGGVFLMASPDGSLMGMSVKYMHGFFPNFFVPGLILVLLSLLTLLAFGAVFRKSRLDWLLANIALFGFATWFTVETIVLQELNMLHIVFGGLVAIGMGIAVQLIPMLRPNKKGGE